MAEAISGLLEVGDVIIDVAGAPLQPSMHMDDALDMLQMYVRCEM